MWVIVAMLVLGAVVPSCSDAPRYDSRLTTADSLMRNNPDSALAIIEAVNRDSLTTEHDRAYRDLLLTQARYKAYIPATSDSDINRALSYYKQHPKEREKLTRAYLYKGAVMEELGFPDSAMIYYKHAEKTAAPEHKCQHADGQHKCQGQTAGEHKCQGAANGEHKCQGQAAGEHKCQGHANGEHKCAGAQEHKCQGQKVDNSKAVEKK